MTGASDRRGFTLIELAVVVLVIALLAALAQPNLHRALTKARAVEAISDLEVLRVAVLNYHATAMVFPADVNRGLVPSVLLPYVPSGFSMVQERYTVDYDNWSTQPEGFVGLTVITTDSVLGNEMVRMLQPNAWSNGSNKFTWVIEWAH